MIFWPDLVFPPINLWSAPRMNIEKKCQKKCKLDETGEVCISCWRTLSEIKRAGQNFRSPLSQNNEMEITHE